MGGTALGMWVAGVDRSQNYACRFANGSSAQIAALCTPGRTAVGGAGAPGTAGRLDCDRPVWGSRFPLRVAFISVILSGPPSAQVLSHDPYAIANGSQWSCDGTAAGPGPGPVQYLSSAAMAAAGAECGGAPCVRFSPVWTGISPTTAAAGGGQPLSVTGYGMDPARAYRLVFDAAAAARRSLLAAVELSSPARHAASPGLVVLPAPSWAGVATSLVPHLVEQDADGTERTVQYLPPGLNVSSGAAAVPPSVAFAACWAARAGASGPAAADAQPDATRRPIVFTGAGFDRSLDIYRCRFKATSPRCSPPPSRCLGCRVQGGSCARAFPPPCYTCA